jgi:hypothetical protein
VSQGANNKLFARGAGFAALAISLTMAPAAQAELEYGVEVGVGHSDNVYRRSVDVVESTIATAGLNVDWQETRRRFDADVVADLTYNHYLEGGIDNNLLGNANGLLSFGIIPDRLTWTLEDTFGQTQQDPLLPATPESLEFLNVLSTGPNVTFRLGSAALLQLNGRYTLTEYEDSPFDSTRTGGGLAVIRELSAHSQVSLNANHQDTDYKDPGNLDFTMRSIYARYALEASRTEISSELGYSWVKRDLPGSEELSEPLIRIEIRRNVSASSFLNLRLASQLSDAAEAARGAAAIIDVGGEPGVGVATASTFENKAATLAWELERPRTALNVSVNWEKDEYSDDSDLDRERMMYGASVTRHLTNRLRLRGGVYMTSEEYALDGSESDETRFLLGAAWQFGRSVGLDFTAERLDRESNIVSGGGDSVENRYFLTVYYRPERTR